MEKYAPEIMIQAMNTVFNIILVLVCGWTTVRLYQLSNSWVCLWTLLMLLFLKSHSFIRD